MISEEHVDLRLVLPCCMVTLLLMASGGAQAQEPGTSLVEADENKVAAIQAGADGFFAQGEGALSFLGETVSDDALAGTFGYGARGGYRWGGWGAFLQLEHNLWFLTDVGEGPLDSVLNLGIGGDVLYAQDRVRTSIAFGTSTILFDTILEEMGTTGFFFDIRPTGFRVPIGDDGLLLEINPITLSMMVPVVEGIPLVQIAYRTVIVAEMGF